MRSGDLHMDTILMEKESSSVCVEDSSDSEG